jgi:hypothetical protein
MHGASRKRVSSGRFYYAIAPRLFYNQQLFIPVEMPDQTFEEDMKKVDYWLNELRSLGINPKSRNSMNSSKELGDFTNNIKMTLYQEYKTAYSET